MEGRGVQGGGIEASVPLRTYLNKVYTTTKETHPLEQQREEWLVPRRRRSRSKIGEECKEGFDVIEGHEVSYFFFPSGLQELIYN